MKKKIAVIIILSIAVISAGLVVLTGNKEPANKEEALKQAREFVCDRTSLTVITPAIHQKTGAEYDFGSSCIPEGWEAKRQ